MYVYFTSMNVKISLNSHTACAQTLNRRKKFQLMSNADVGIFVWIHKDTRLLSKTAKADHIGSC